MGRDYRYKEGSFYQVDDRTGFPQRVEKTRQQWDNLVVDEKVWEARHPQDFVRGVRDNQSVELPRPISEPTFILPVWATVMEEIPIGGTEIPLHSVFTFGIGSHVAVMLDADMGNMFHTVVTFVGVLSGGLVGVIIRDPVPRVVSQGQQFWNFSLGEALPPEEPPCWIVSSTPATPPVDWIIAGQIETPPELLGGPVPFVEFPVATDWIIAGTPDNPSCLEIDPVHTHHHTAGQPRAIAGP